MIIIDKLKTTISFYYRKIYLEKSAFKILVFIFAQTTTTCIFKKYATIPSDTEYVGENVPVPEELNKYEFLSFVLLLEEKMALVAYCLLLFQENQINVNSLGIAIQILR